MKKVSKNIFTAVVLSIFTLSLFVGCSNSKKTEVKDVSVKDISSKIEQAVDISKLRVGDSKKLKKLYEIEAEEVEEFVLFTPPSNIKVDELLLLKIKDSEKLDEIKEKITKRIEKQKECYKDYLPDECFLLEKHVLKNNGNYILFVVSKDAEKIESTFDGFFE